MRLLSTVSYALAMACYAFGQTYSIQPAAGAGWPDKVPGVSAACVYSVDAQTLGAAASGDSLTVKVTTGSGCAWTASSSVGWLTLTAGASGSGTVTCTAAANPVAALRTGVLTVAGQTIYLNQAGAGQAAPLVSVTNGGIVNAASGATPIAPGSFISIFGQNLSDVTDTWNSAIAGLALPVSLGGVRVRINGQECYLHYVSPGQINVVSPPDPAAGPVLVEVVTPHGTAAATVAMSQVSPGWFTYAAQGKTYVAALTAPDNLLAAPAGAVPGAASRPAASGEYVQLFGTGLGVTNPPYPAGQVLTTSYPVADLSKVRATVGGQPASVSYAGMVSPGLFQVNILVPDTGISGSLPVVLSIGGQTSQTDAMVAFTFATPLPPALRVVKTHSGNFRQGQAGAAYTVVVSNAGGSPTSGPVTVTETLPVGLSLAAMEGTGWTCSANSCTRSDALEAASSYPALTVTVNVAAGAPAQVINRVGVSGGGAATASASDLTVIDRSASYPGTSIAVMQSPVPGSVLAGPTVTFTWSAGVGVSAYRIDVGASPGSVEYFLGSWGDATSQVVTNLPVNGTAVCASLSSLTDGVWQVSYYCYSAVGGAAGTPSYLISTIAGGAQPATAVSATTIAIPGPVAVATDAAGNVYFSSAILNSVFKLSAVGLLTRVAGNGAAGSAGDGGAATSAALAGPAALAVDRAGNLYIADANNNRIRKVSASTGAITTVAGNGARTDFSGDGGPATSATLDWPQGVAVDPAGNLYIADTGRQRIRKVTASTGAITTVAGNGEWGFSGDGGSATSAALNHPTNVAVDAAGNLYIADSPNQRIRKVTASSGVITTVAGTGTAGFSGDGGPATGARLYYPDGVALDAAGNLYIADAGNYCIRKVTASTGLISTVAGGGWPDLGDSGDATSAALNWPEGVAVDATGNLYIADTRNSRIRKVSPGGIISTVAGGGGVGDGRLGVFARLAQTSGVARDSAGNVYISDSFDHRVRKVSANGVISTVAGVGTAGFAGDGGVATRAALNEPSGLALDAAGNLYIADAWNNRIRRVTAATGVITTVAGNGNGAFSGDGGAATSAALWGPAAVALDAAGNLYIADRSNSRIRKVTAADGTITTVAGSGTWAYSGDGGPATKAAMGSPSGVAVDAAGNLYIADPWSSTVRKVASAGGVITTVAGNFTNLFLGDGGPASAAILWTPGSLALDAAGNLYIADQGNGRIRRVAASNGIITTVAGNGIWSYSGDGGAATTATLYYPSAMTVDVAGNIYVADTYNGAVRLLTPTETSPVLTVSSAHNGAFTAGQSGSYTLTVANAPSAGATSGTVTVTEVLPAALTLVSMSGAGWSCSGATCTRSDPVSGGGSYPAIAVVATVSSTASEQVTNQVSVSGGGAAITGTQDLTLIHRSSQ